MASALSPTSLLISALCEALQVMAGQRAYDIHPSRAHFGLIDVIPFDVWTIQSSQSVDSQVEALLQDKLLSVSWCLDILKCGLPSILKNHLLGPCKNDSLPPSYRCLIPIFEDYPIEKHVRIRETNDAALLKEALVGKIIYCLHCYFGAFLARGVDAVQALHYPGNPALKLNFNQRLALGFVRETVILKHFPTLGLFWQIFASMHAQGKYMAGYLDSGNFFEPSQVIQLLHDDPLAYGMYSILMTISCSSESVVLIHDRVDYFISHPMEAIIGKKGKWIVPDDD